MRSSEQIKVPLADDRMKPHEFTAIPESVAKQVRLSVAANIESIHLLSNRNATIWPIFGVFHLIHVIFQSAAPATSAATQSALKKRSVTVTKRPGGFGFRLVGALHRFDILYNTNVRTNSCHAYTLISLSPAPRTSIVTVSAWAPSMQVGRLRRPDSRAATAL